MDYFAFGFKDYAMHLYDYIGRRAIISFAVFFEAFCKRWCPNNIDQWLPKVQEVKTFYDAQKIVEEGPIPPLKEEEGTKEKRHF